MGIKYLRGNIVGGTEFPVTNFRPPNFDYPRGLATKTPLSTFDALIVGGGGGGGNGQPRQGGSGGGGGFRLITGNTFTEAVEGSSFSFAGGACACIPVVVGGGGAGGYAGPGGASSFGGSAFCSIGGGCGTGRNYGFNPPSGGPGGSGGGGGSGGPGGTGIAGQGCNGGCSPGPGTGGGGGSACLTGCNNATSRPGITTSFTGAPVEYSCGGGGTTPNTIIGGGGGQGPNPGSGVAGSAGIVAIRYCNPVAPTTPIVNGGNCVCCTGGCILHIFTASGFLCTDVSRPIN